MYNLLVSGNEESWDGQPWQIELDRCVREYTDTDITTRFGSLSDDVVAQLKKLPSIFAYEAFHGLAPKFGTITNIVSRQGQVRIEYEFQPLDRFLTADELREMAFELDISKWEMNRTHWAVKDVNLAKELAPKGIKLPGWASSLKKRVDIEAHRFAIALSFPGEVRTFVEAVAKELERIVGPDTYFYDNNYQAQLARPGLDLLLQDIYGNRSDLIVVFLSGDYERKDWCGIEFRAIRELISRRDNKRVMYIRTDDGDVAGVFRTDGYVDARKFTPQQIADFINERSMLLE